MWLRHSKLISTIIQKDDLRSDTVLVAPKIKSTAQGGTCGIISFPVLIACLQLCSRNNSRAKKDGVITDLESLGYIVEPDGFVDNPRQSQLAMVNGQVVLSYNPDEPFAMRRMSFAGPASPIGRTNLQALPLLIEKAPPEEVSSSATPSLDSRDITTTTESDPSTDTTPQCCNAQTSGSPLTRAAPAIRPLPIPPSAPWQNRAHQHQDLSGSDSDSATDRANRGLSSRFGRSSKHYQ
ncbi:hypothetical protein FA15DRAFT_705907 [Coprinopsis marcescibilis]|uniref:Uncharacterized protein n=1 Tax=Coprinopsis marcescibilis TaxID=230819 RepID=A0A5C3KQY0_COPMA|nr:hypothetical protein FA15DRAFT_705907 [Coprinopsis marcescibilis]